MITLLGEVDTAVRAPGPWLARRRLLHAILFYVDQSALPNAVVTRHVVCAAGDTSSRYRTISIVGMTIVLNRAFGVVTNLL